MVTNPFRREWRHGHGYWALTAFLVDAAWYQLGPLLAQLLPTRTMSASVLAAGVWLMCLMALTAAAIYLLLSWMAQWLDWQFELAARWSISVGIAVLAAIAPATLVFTEAIKQFGA